MFVKLTVLACSIAVVVGVWNGPLAGGVPAHQFPAGISPQACPNFPHCSNPSVAANPNAPAPYNSNPVPQYNGYNPGQQYGGYNPAPVTQYNPSRQAALDRGEYVGDGDYHGEGLAEALAPGYAGQYGGYNNPAPAYNPGLPAGVPAQIPAGVDARSCPNYPFCH
ncbi:uncharacterized protein LOC135134481 [Zophobas morio]|uniref:uncharacterized protein LOC135134481 n=1 Tax=Zophobas morio TaxID=2755281 RepID=UPI003082BB48